MFEIVNTRQEADELEEFVALGYINDDGLEHSAIIIRHKGEVWMFHYTGLSIQYEKVTDDACFHKITYTIDNRLLPAFIIMCKNILRKKSVPLYGYFYTGEFYNYDGEHVSTAEIGHTMTCAGFCTNVMKGFLEEDYISFEDWDSSSHDAKNYVQQYARSRGLDELEISASHRRISPLDLLCSGFFTTLPIRKVQIDSKLPEVRDYIELY